ncbi:MAG: hypothetical protein IT249_00120 [Chitinophagaceae bacterium]|nr:hypothetical protein [Chitinophagaceae bacterium]
MTTATIRPVFPINGDVLHVLDGMLTGEGLACMAKVSAPSGSSITINNIPAKEIEAGIFSAPVVLGQYQNTVEIQNQSSGESTTITVYFAKQFAKKYRLSIDDNIRFLQDIAENTHAYTSVLDNPFLKGLKKLHDQYQTKVHINLFYQSVGEDFTISDFPDSFKKEWQENADWLRLSFHAYKEFPDAPYKNASFDTVKKDCDLIIGEIKRFAGDALLGPVTTVHWGEVTVEGSRAMRAAGYKGQLGYFNVDDDQPTVSYYLDVEQRRHIKKRFIWKDEAEDIIFIRSSMVLDRTKKENIVSTMNAYASAPSGLPPYVDYLIHEQYFYPDYAAYQPDYFEKIATAVQWAKEHGYEPAFLDECIFE